MAYGRAPPAERKRSPRQGKGRCRRRNPCPLANVAERRPYERIHHVAAVERSVVRWLAGEKSSVSYILPRRPLVKRRR
jgi:hypothetical protein